MYHLYKEKYVEKACIPPKEALVKAKIRPGDWVETVAQDDKLVVRAVHRENPQRMVSSVAGAWSKHKDMADELLNIRDDG